MSGNHDIGKFMVTYRDREGNRCAVQVINTRQEDMARCWARVFKKPEEKYELARVRREDVSS